MYISHYHTEMAIFMRFRWLGLVCFISFVVEIAYYCGCHRLVLVIALCNYLDIISAMLVSARSSTPLKV